MVIAGFVLTVLLSGLPWFALAADFTPHQPTV